MAARTTVRGMHVFNARTGLFDLDTSNSSQVAHELTQLKTKQNHVDTTTFADQASPLILAACMHPCAFPLAKPVVDSLWATATTPAPADDQPAPLSSLPPSALTAITSFFASTGNAKQALEAYHVAKQVSHAIPPALFSVVIRALADANLLEDAAAVLTDAKHADAIPSAVAFTSLALAAHRAGDLEAVKACLREMQQRDLQPVGAADTETQWDELTRVVSSHVETLEKESMEEAARAKHEGVSVWELRARQHTQAQQQ